MDFFEAFWDAYPKHMTRHKAHELWEKNIKKGISAEEMIKAAQNYARAREGEDPQFTMYASTFLGRSQRWRDFVDGIPKDYSQKEREKIKKIEKYEGFYL